MYNCSIRRIWFLSATSDGACHVPLYQQQNSDDDDYYANDGTKHCNYYDPGFHGRLIIASSLKHRHTLKGMYSEINWLTNTQLAGGGFVEHFV